jgi:hypothetical protein
MLTEEAIRELADAAARGPHGRLMYGAEPAWLTAFARLVEAAERERLRGLYEELLFAVGNKCPGETRHQTALRYIQQAEAPRISAAQCEGPNA